ncbi:TIGR03435 family protein [Silvibacterium sp.]|uniref:TIGR03435 family protein n=1 Tax=Silvibacterium sp. TaxID=1964179 RepID=UPI0039E51A58
MAARLIAAISFAFLLLAAGCPMPSIALPAAQSSAQSPVSPPGANPPLMKFEVTSIRPHLSGPNDPSNRRMLPGGRFVATATSVRTLIRIAFGADDRQIAGAPGWIDSQLFDIAATTVNRADVTTPEQFQALILSLLEDRFQFQFHREQKEGPIYWLEVEKPGRLGPAVKASAPASQPNMSSSFDGARKVLRASKCP